MKARWVPDGKRLRLEGELDFVSVIPMREELDRFLTASAGTQVTLDLSGVTRVNSVGLSLLLSAARTAQASKVQLQADGLPAGLMSMATVCGLDAWLETLSAATVSTMEIPHAGH
ncbi:MAG: STAS domain-containing protein [Pseudomonas sp.]